MKGEYEVLKNVQRLAGKPRARGEVLSVKEELAGVKPAVINAMVSEGILAPVTPEDDDKLERLQSQLDAQRDILLAQGEKLEQIAKLLLANSPSVSSTKADSEVKQAAEEVAETATTEPPAAPKRRRRNAAKKEG